ncbi:MAG: lipid-A-disaccharide synthase [Syntrophorhabdaceae bacterium]|nr:lipid-A-disaccharide synthase [Syntrophorhabdaceae bacterium]
MKDSIQKNINKHIVILTGELSGEIHGTNLIKSIRKKCHFTFSGMGGEKFRQNNINLVYNYKEISLMGISELFKKALPIIIALKKIKKHIKEIRPILVILIDFPGFNLRIAKYAKGIGIPIVYFIPPQVWAWHKSRIKAMKKYVDLVISILPFEKKFYQSHGIEAKFAGHPFMDTVRPKFGRDEFLKRIDATDGKKIITIMPGSRENEIKRHMPAIIESIKLLKKRLGVFYAVLPIADNIHDDLIKNFIKKEDSIIPLKGLNYDALYHCDAAIIASGSATLEAAILGTPSVVIYKISTFSYLLARLLVDVKFISLPNIILEKELFPEIIQQLNPEIIAEKVMDMLNFGRDGIKKDVEMLKTLLGTSATYDIAASEIIDFLDKRYGTLFQAP